MVKIDSLKKKKIMFCYDLKLCKTNVLKTKIIVFKK